MTDAHPARAVEIAGHISSRPRSRLIRLLFLMTGLALIGGLAGLAARYLLLLRRRGRLAVAEHLLQAEVTTSLFGATIRSRTFSLPLRNVRGVGLEQKAAFVHLAVGAAFLTAGLLAGIHWLLDGLRAGYPYLALLGAGIILAGLGLDLLLFLLIPGSDGPRTVLLETDSRHFRMEGVDAHSSDQFVASVRAAMNTPTPPAADS